MRWIVILIAVALWARTSDADVAVRDFDLALIGGYTWVETGQAVRTGPVFGHDRHVGPVTLHGEYAFLVWVRDNAQGAVGHEHALSFAAQLDLDRRRDRDVRGRAYVGVGVTGQWLALEHGSEADTGVFVDAGLDLRGSSARGWPDFFGVVFDVRVGVGPAVHVADDTVAARRVTPTPTEGDRGHDWSLLMTIGNGFSF